VNRPGEVIPIVLAVTVMGAVGQSLLKHSVNTVPPGSTLPLALRHFLTAWHFYAGGVVVTLGFGAWLYALSRADLSYATPFLSFGFVTTMVASWLFLHEPVTVGRALGTLIIVAGMLLVGRG